MFKSMSFPWTLTRVRQPAPVVEKRLPPLPHHELGTRSSRGSASLVRVSPPSPSSIASNAPVVAGGGAAAGAVTVPPARPRPDPMSLADAQQCGYQLMAWAQGERITDENELRVLRDVTRSMERARALLPKGRSNVLEDLHPDGASFIAGQVGRHIAREQVGRDLGTLNRAYPDVPFQQLPRARVRSIQAAAAALVGAGYCSEYSQLVTHLHVGKMQEGDRFINCVHASQDHEWPQLVYRLPDGLRGVVEACAWMNGPAVKIPHARMSFDRSEVEETPGIDASQRSEVLKRFKRDRREVKRQWDRNADLLVQHWPAHYPNRPVEAWPAQPILSDEFCRKSLHHMQALGRRRLEAMAAEIAQTAYGLEEQDAVRIAPLVVGLADEMARNRLESTRSARHGLPRPRSFSDIRSAGAEARRREPAARTRSDTPTSIA